MVIDSQLKWILTLFNANGVIYWLNSGTLLGLMREGKLLDYDQDIDLGLWADDEAALQELLPQFKKAGYNVFSAAYKGLTFHYVFSLRGVPGSRSVDIHLFRRYGEYAWSPDYYFKIQPGRARGRRKKEIYRFLRGTLRYFWRRFIARVPLTVSVSSWPWHCFVNPVTWWIPAAYFDELEFREDLEAYIPADWQGYLEWRYGDWRVPRRNWVFHRDDGGLKPGSPEQVRGLMDSLEKQD